MSDEQKQFSEMLSAYNAQETESKIYQKWLDSGYFNPDKLPGERPEVFSMMLPPPNVTGTLHLGHAYEHSIQDVAVRYQRMLGKKTLWLPGTDHAPIATESKVAKILEKEEKKNKKDLGRQEFVDRVKQFASDSHDTIINQVKKLGNSVDWSREAYTFDEARNLAVRTAFKTLYDLGLIYRGFKVVNWDPKGQTVISDDEIVYEERKAKLYTFKYSSDFPIAISSTRPETKLGDTAVAVHPTDDRYKQYIGKEFTTTFCGQEIHIKIIADESVEKDFGTGALGVTPAHSQIDAEIAERHNLPMKQIIDEYGKMTVGLEGVKGKKTAEAREEVAKWIKEQGLLISEEEVSQNVSTAERTGAIIEPLPKMQWFVAVNTPFKLPLSKIEGIQSEEEVTLKQLMRHVVESGQITIEPDRFIKTYFHWINNLRDWCISRQLWFGHQIPVWYKDEKIFCGIESPGDDWTQDPDTLDTWFSSALWTFSTLGWPKQTEDLKKYHPTSLMMPGYEILFFWVARMVLMSTTLLGEIPFKRVNMHGIVRDSQGRKFSKSLNNGVDPLEMIEKYGADALRMALIFGAAPGNDTVFDEQKVKGMKHFANKLWNITRFILGNLENEITIEEKPVAQTAADTDILEKLENTIKEVTQGLESLHLHEAAHAIYQFTWKEFADVYLEATKEQLKNPTLKQNTQETLVYTLTNILRILHPFMPFVTEEIWSKLNKKDLLLVKRWPKN